MTVWCGYCKDSFLPDVDWLARWANARAKRFARDAWTTQEDWDWFQFDYDLIEFEMSGGSLSDWRASTDLAKLGGLL